MIALLLIAILAVILVAVFANTAFYVAGAIIGLLLCIAAYIIRRRKTR